MIHELKNELCELNKAYNSHKSVDPGIYVARKSNDTEQPYELRFLRESDLGKIGDNSMLITCSPNDEQLAQCIKQLTELL